MPSPPDLKKGKKPYLTSDKLSEEYYDSQNKKFHTRQKAYAWLTILSFGCMLGTLAYHQSNLDFKMNEKLLHPNSGPIAKDPAERKLIAELLIGEMLVAGIGITGFVHSRKKKNNIDKEAEINTKLYYNKINTLALKEPVDFLLDKALTDPEEASDSSPPNLPGPRI